MDLCDPYIVSVVVDSSVFISLAPGLLSIVECAWCLSSILLGAC